MSNFGFPEGTLVLVLDGWKPIETIKVGDQCITYCKDKNILVQGVVEGTLSNDSSALIKATHTHLEFVCGKDQKWFGWKRVWAKKGLPRPKKHLEFTLSETTQDYNITCSAEYVGGENKDVSPEDAALLGWLLSDGYYKWKPDTKNTSSSFGKKRGVTGMIAQAQHKFYKEVEEVIEDVGLEYTMHEDSTGVKTSPVNKYHFKSAGFRSFMDRVVKERLPKNDINWTRHIIGYSKPALYQYLYNFWLADGDTKGCTFLKGGTKITQNFGTVSESILLSMFLQGRRVSQVEKDSEGKCKTLRMLRSGHVTMQEIKKEDVGSSRTYDLNTSEGSYIIRQGDHISITCTSYNKEPTNDQ